MFMNLFGDTGMAMQGCEVSLIAVTLFAPRLDQECEIQPKGVPTQLKALESNANVCIERRNVYEFVWRHWHAIARV